MATRPASGRRSDEWWTRVRVEGSEPVTAASHPVSRRRDRPIIFSAPMVSALLDGRKTQTRRILKLPTKGEYFRPDMGGWAPTINGGIGVFTIGRDGTRHPAPETVGIWNQTTGTCLDAPWQVHDRLWVREAWKAHSTFEGVPPRDIPRSNVFYLADERYSPSGSRARASIHMPRWASRLTLTVTDVRVQPLQEISEGDAVAEGLERLRSGRGYYDPTLSHEVGRAACRFGGWFEKATTAYQALWNSLHGPDAWSANPWVVALTFTVEQRNIDALGEAA